MVITDNKKNPANSMGNVQQRCMFESPVKQDLSQSPEGTRRPAAKLSIVFYSYTHQRERSVSLSQRCIGWKSQIFPTPSLI